jgi:hypothetical protein
VGIDIHSTGDSRQAWYGKEALGEEVLNTHNFDGGLGGRNRRLLGLELVFPVLAP